MTIIKSESIKELAASLAKAQGMMAAAKMDATNPFLKNKYADLGSVIEAAKNPLQNNGLSYSQHPSLADNQLTITTLLMHSSGEWLESSLTLEVTKGNGISMAQSMGAVITYLRRYSLASILGVYADEDTDGNDNKPAKKEHKDSDTIPQAPTHAPIPHPEEMAAEQPKANGKPPTNRNMIKFNGAYIPADWISKVTEKWSAKKVNAYEAQQILSKLDMEIDTPDDIAMEAVNAYLRVRKEIDPPGTVDEAVTAALEYLKFALPEKGMI